MPAVVFCVSWCADFKFRVACRRRHRGSCEAVAAGRRNVQSHGGEDGQQQHSALALEQPVRRVRGQPEPGGRQRGSEPNGKTPRCRVHFGILCVLNLSRSH